MRTIQSPVDSSFTPESIGDRIQHARRVLGVFLGWDITQAHLAAMLGISEVTVAGLEGDSVDVAPFTEALCEMLGIRREFLLAGDSPMTGAVSSRMRQQWLSAIQGTRAPVVAAFSG